MSEEYNNTIIEKEPSENFLEHHNLYRGVDRDLWSQWRDREKIYPVFYRQKNAIGGLSVDWRKYFEQCDTLRNKGNDLSKWGVVQINVGQLRNCILQNNFPIEIEHDPKPKNPAHSLLNNITQINKMKIKIALAEIAEWAPSMKPKPVKE